MKKRVLISLLIPIVIISVCGCVSSDTINQNSTQTCSTAAGLTGRAALTTHVSTATAVPSSTTSHATSNAQKHPSPQPSVRATSTPTPAKAPTYPVATSSATKTPATPSPAAYGPFYGCRACGVYHYPWCPEASKILPIDLVKFNSPAEARAAGMSPCSVCHPP